MLSVYRVLLITIKAIVSPNPSELPTVALLSMRVSMLEAGFPVLDTGLESPDAVERELG